MHCKKIRTDDEIWESIEQYLSEHSEARLRHGICPTCMKEKYGDMFDEDELGEF